MEESVPPKRKVNQHTHKMWKWSQEEIQASPGATRGLWQARQTLEDVTHLLGIAWKSLPYLIVTEMATTQIDQGTLAKCSLALRGPSHTLRKTQ